MIVRQPFAFKQETKSIDGMLEISLRGCFASLLKLVEVILNLFRIKASRKALKVQSYGRHMTAIVIEGSGAAAENGDVTFKAIEESFESANFTAGAIEILIKSQFFRRFFFVVIIKV